AGSSARALMELVSVTQVNKVQRIDECGRTGPEPPDDKRCVDRFAPKCDATLRAPIKSASRVGAEQLEQTVDHLLVRLVLGAVAATEDRRAALKCIRVLRTRRLVGRVDAGGPASVVVGAVIAKLPL